MEKRYKQVQPCGMLYSNGREYFLLRPSPEKQLMEWEKWDTFRWLAVPKNVVGVLGEDYRFADYYSYKRHVITNSFVVEFMAGMPKILILVDDEYDLSEMEE
jgi:hypothetical protein